MVDTHAYSDDPGGWRGLVSAVTNADTPSVVSTDDDHRYLLFTVRQG
ncbi:hypothetical protein [Subtercola sp. YIM 133946]